VRYKLPYGKQYGPANVTIDLTGTFDPEGDPITEYDVQGGSGLPLTVSLTPQFNLTLQPGCYNLVLIAKTAGGSGFAVCQLKVYRPGRARRLSYGSRTRTAFSSSAGWRTASWLGTRGRRKTLFGGDFAARALGIRQEVTPGSYSYATLPTYSSVQYMGDPLLLNGAYYVPLSTSAAVNLAIGTPRPTAARAPARCGWPIPGIPMASRRRTSTHCRRAGRGGHPWIFYGYIDGGIAKLAARQMTARLAK